MGEWKVGQWIVGVISFQKIFGLCGLKGQSISVYCPHISARIQRLTRGRQLLMARDYNTYIHTCTAAPSKYFLYTWKEKYTVSLPPLAFQDVLRQLSPSCFILRTLSWARGRCPAPFLLLVDSIRLPSCLLQAVLFSLRLPV